MWANSPKLGPQLHRSRCGLPVGVINGAGATDPLPFESVIANEVSRVLDPDFTLWCHLTVSGPGRQVVSRSAAAWPPAGKGTKPACWGRRGQHAGSAGPPTPSREAQLCRQSTQSPTRFCKHGGGPGRPQVNPVLESQMAVYRKLSFVIILLAIGRLRRRSDRRDGIS